MQVVSVFLIIILNAKYIPEKQEHKILIINIVKV